MNEKKYLIKKYETIFEKIKNIIKKIFNKVKNNDDNLIKSVEPNTKYLNTLEKDVKIDDEEIEKKLMKISEDFSKRNEKENFFKLYYDYKNKKIKAKDIPFAKLIKINKLLKEEIKIMVNDYNTLELMVIDDDLREKNNI